VLTNDKVVVQEFGATEAVFSLTRALQRALVYAHEVVEVAQLPTGAACNAPPVRLSNMRAFVRFRPLQSLVGKRGSCPAGTTPGSPDIVSDGSFLPDLPESSATKGKGCEHSPISESLPSKGAPKRKDPVSAVSHLMAQKFSSVRMQTVYRKFAK
jgi:hypothetical protein